jgi:SAM-dependent methyltransferase
VTQDVWASGDAYEAYVGRWSRPIAARFVEWVAVPAGRRWLDVGCGTGALTATVLSVAGPAEVVGVDQSAGFLATASARIDDPRTAFQPADAASLPFPDDRFDAVVSGLVLNFVAEPAAAVAEWARVAAPGAVVAAYLWDYSAGMRFMREFWDAAAAVDPAAADVDEQRRFPMCRPEPMRGLWDGAGLREVSVSGIEIPTTFADFDDFWRPFLGGQGPAPGYLMSRDEEQRAAIRDLLVQRLPQGADGSIPLTARAWAVKGIA